jgi:hypothetical protein
MKTLYDSWTVSDLLESLDRGRLLLPPYQRRGVWDEEKQKMLVTSLRKQWPIGSLLLCKAAEGKGDEYLLIDGQQRVTAIRQYCKNPCHYLDPKDIDSSVLESLCEFVSREKGQDCVEGVTHAVAQWLSGCSGMSKADGFSPSTLAAQIEERMSLGGGVALAGKCEDVVDCLRANWDLAGREVAIVIYNGSSDEISEIFRLINSTGEPLDKFDITAASWYSEGTDTIIKNSSVVSRIKAGYEKQKADGMTFAVPFEDREPMLVEYLFGLGKLLVSKYPVLFGKPSALNETDEIGFNIAATAHGLGIGWKPIAKLNRVMKARASVKGKIDPGRFEKSLIESCDFVLECLNHILAVRLNRSGLQEPPELLHNTSHMLSMICRVLVGKYSEDFKGVRREWATESRVLRRTLPQFYLEDILEEKWTGAAATRLFECVWRRDGAKCVPSPYYLEERDREQWKQMLSAYHERSKMRRRKTGRYIQKHQKVFLKYAMQNALLLKHQLGAGCEIEHLFPVSRLEQLVQAEKSDSAGWAIDHVANLALFTRKMNREKSKQTLAEFCDGKKRAELKTLAAEGLSPAMLMCEVDQVAIPSGKGKRFTRAQYESFLDDRYGRMRDAVLVSLLSDRR